MSGLLRCAIRGKEVSDTPEDRVRQKLAAFLVAECGVPKRNVSVEVDLRSLGLDATGRADLVVWNFKEGGTLRTPWLLAECKAPGALVPEAVEAQLARYLRGCAPKRVLATDGDALLLWERTEGEGRVSFRRAEDLPRYS